MHRYHKLGKVAKKRHTVFRDKDGNIYHEELKGNKGFVGPSSLLYHIYPPTEVLSTKQIGTFELEEEEDRTTDYLVPTDGKSASHKKKETKTKTPF